MRQRRQAYVHSAGAAKEGREHTSTTSAALRKIDEEEEPGHPGVSKPHLDFLFKQLRQICYRKVRGNGNDVSIREIFRHFDSEKVCARERGVGGDLGRWGSRTEWKDAGWTKNIANCEPASGEQDFDAVL